VGAALAATGGAVTAGPGAPDAAGLVGAAMREPVRAPGRLLQWAESRAAFELVAFLASSPALRLVGRGDRHPVLVLPGFTTSDRATEPLRWVLRSQGYWVHGWGLGTNLGPTRRVVDGIHDRLRLLHDRHGRPVTLIGHSLGGIYAREMARQNPGAVRQVITLGSPFRLERGDRSAASPIADRVEHRWLHDAIRLGQAEPDKPPVPVPSTAIYSRTDGVVRWHTCIEERGERRENIEVVGSHIGLAVHPAVVLAVSDRLAQPEGRWRPFRPPIGLRHLYPRPAYYIPRHHRAG
jgi:pimeloyl-ACP methyl ester carboxylesterase